MVNTLEKDKKDKSYNQIMKATSIFGGVQVFNILISILRSKLIAIFLGPAGIGVFGLLNSTILLISSLTNFGLGISSVKDISIANDSADNVKVSKILAVVKKLIWFTGLFGALITLSLSSWLSEITFGDLQYTMAFVWLSITVLLKQLASGQFVILQGLRRLKDLAMANVVGSALGLLVSVPLYIYLGLDGIVPGLVITAVFTYLAAQFYGNKISVPTDNVSIKGALENGKSMLTMGITLSLSGIMVLGEAYALRIFINYSGGVEQVGLYNAGIALITTYVGLLFKAMETDYYPRLSAVAHDNKLANNLVNQQTEIALLILAPVLIGLLVFINWVIIILYSSDFISVNVMIYWAFLGLFFRVPAWVIGFIFVSKGKSKVFFWNELISNLYLLAFNIIGYHYGGLKGLGISFLFSYALYLLQVFLVAKHKYQFAFSTGVIKILVFQLTLAVVCFLTLQYVGVPFNYLIGVPIILISMWFSLVELNKRLDLSSFFKKKGNG